MRLVVADRPDYADDTALVEACLRRDRAAERELFRRMFPKVNATVYRVLGPHRDTDDLIQEALVEVFRSLRTFRGESKLSTWIDRIAVRTAMRGIGRLRVDTVPLELVPDVADDGEPPDRRAHAREGVRRLYAALARLKPAARVAFALHAIDGRPLAEVANLTGSTAIATKLRVWRARNEVERHAAADPILAEYLEGVAHDP